MTADEEKRLAGEAAVEFVRDGMVLGLGTGSTMYHFIRRLGGMVSRGTKVIGIPTSVQTERLAREVGMEIGTLENYSRIDLTVDGADEVDPELDLIKGLGGALFREKVVAKASRSLVIVVDSSKLVRVLGEKMPVPVEVHMFGWKASVEWLKELGCKPSLRKSGMTPYMTDNGNFIVDCAFGPISNPAALEQRINNVPGVLENGIFTGMADTVIVGRAGGVEKLRRPRRTASVA